jgi:hypothetical protein
MGSRWRLPSGRTFLLLSFDYDHSIARIMWTHAEHVGSRHEDLPEEQVADAVMTSARP